MRPDRAFSRAWRYGCAVPRPSASRSALLACLAVPVCGYAQLQAGWSEQSVQSFTAGCVEAIVDPAKIDFAQAAAKAGDNTAVFPAKEVRSSVNAMCACLAQRIATTWSLHEWELNDGSYLASLIDEAFAGGRCKPEGLLSEVLSRAKAKRAK